MCEAATVSGPDPGRAARSLLQADLAIQAGGPAQWNGPYTYAPSSTTSPRPLPSWGDTHARLVAIAAEFGLL